MTRGHDADRDLNDELRSYLELLVDEKLRSGLSADDARRAALLEIGGATQVAEAVRDVRPGAWLGEIARDTRYALRGLRRDLAFTVTAALTLAIGIGANMTIFAIVDTVILRTLPVRAPEQLVAIGKPTAIDAHLTGAPRGDVFSLPLYRDLRDRNHVLSGLAASASAGRLDVRAASGAAVENPVGRFVSGNYFDVLGVGSAIGRLLEPGDDVAGAAPVVVISDGYRQRHFGTEPSVVGHTIVVNDVSLTIAGVAAPEFAGEIAERPTDLWLPLGLRPLLYPHDAPVEDRATMWLLLTGRLAPNVTLAQARAGITTLIHDALMANATSSADRERFRRVPTFVGPGARGFSAARSTYAVPLRTLGIAVGLLLLIVCTNVANLLLARAVARGREITLRLALGANPGRIVRQLMTENTLLAVLGCLPSVVFGWWMSHLLVSITSLPSMAATRLDLNFVVFMVGLTSATVLLFGLAPAIRASRADVAIALRTRSPASAFEGMRGRVPIGRLLVPLQVTLSLVLLAGAALLARNLSRLESADAGLDRKHLLVLELDVARRGYTGLRLVNFIDQLSNSLANLPGVRAVSYSQNGLFRGRDGSAVVAIPGFQSHVSEDSVVNYDLVGPDYVHAIGARLVRGRDIAPSDGLHAPNVAVVNDALARFYFHGDAIGKTIYFDAGIPTTIVGIVADVKDHSLVRPNVRRAYAAYVQQLSDSDHPSLFFEIESAADPAAITRSVRDAVGAIDRGVPIAGLSPVSVLMRDSIREARLLTTVSVAFGLVAVLLASIGLYGVMMYSVSRRSAELGVRTALGAERGDLLVLVLVDALRLVAIGAAVGAPLALGAARLLRSQLVGVSPVDPIALSSALVVLTVTALTAALLPAQRASRVSPVVALRSD